MARIRSPEGIRFVITLVAALLLASPASARFGWPDPATHPRVIFNADQSLAGYMDEHPEWFQNDFLVTSLYVKDVPYGQSDTARKTFVRIQDKLWDRGINFGSYVSGTTAIPEMSLTKFPPDAVSIEDMSVKVGYLGPWLRDPQQKAVDLKDPASFFALETGIGDLWRHTHGIVRFIDNAAVHPRVASMQPWENYCLNIKLLRAYEETQGIVTIFNVFVRSWEMTDKETKLLIDAVAGHGYNAVSFPLAWSREIKDDKTANGWAIYRYRQMLDGGMVLIFVPSAEANVYELSGWLATWRRPYDRVYIAAPYWDPPPW
jgi:hypothetical protein